MESPNKNVEKIVPLEDQITKNTSMDLKFKKEDDTQLSVDESIRKSMFNDVIQNKSPNQKFSKNNDKVKKNHEINESLEAINFEMKNATIALSSNEIKSKLNIIKTI